VFAEADTLARESLADEHVVATPFDLAGRTHPADLVPGLIEAARPCARRWLPELDGRLLVERLMREVLRGRVRCG
jgi:hypothetical protein